MLEYGIEEVMVEGVESAMKVEDRLQDVGDW